MTACDLATRVGCRVVAFDSMPAFLADAYQRVRRQGLIGRVGIVAADGKQLPVPDALCDAASCVGAAIIVGLPDALSEIARITKPGGLVVVSDARRA